MIIENIFFSMDYSPIGIIDKNPLSTDVIVDLDNGIRYMATFFTYGAISRIANENEISGEFLEGTYFYSNNMILIDVCSKEQVTRVIHHLIDEGEFSFVFKSL
ncbi:MAG: hypothetical protein AAF388_04120 [Bacteroidota bacterium]